MKFAGFWPRLLAYLIDVIPIVLIVYGVFYFFLGFDETLNLYHENPNNFENRLHYLFDRSSIRDISFFIWIFYCVFMEASSIQGSLGKKVVGVKVVDKDGARLSFRKSLVRNLSKLLSYIPLCLGGLWIAFSKNKRGWHDMIAKTYVVERGVTNDTV